MVGDELAAPFGALADASGSVSGAGQAAQDAVATLATVLAVVLVVLPVGWLLLRWLPWRLRYAREAGAARRLLGRDAGPGRSLAARALATAPLPRLAALPAGTGAAWHAGDPAAVRALAALELGRLGLRLPEPRPGRAASLARAGVRRPERCAASRASGRGPARAASSPHDRRGVADVAVEHPLDGVGQRHPVERHVRLLVLDEEALGTVDGRQALGEVDLHAARR